MHLIQGLKWVAWNIFLAFIPVVTAYIIWTLARTPEMNKRVWAKVSIALLGLIWFAFLPNTCYLLTEWRHFLDVLGWTDLPLKWQSEQDSAIVMALLVMFYACYSGIGVLTFALAIRPIDRLIRPWTRTRWVWGVMFFLMMSTGVYLGLVLRFNSWDLLTRLDQVWASVVVLPSRPVLSSFIILFGGFLWLVYLTVDIWIDGLLLRLGRIPAANP